MLAAACNPYKGSDSAAGWGRAVETAKHFETWVICGHWDKTDIDGFLAEHGEIPGLHFCFLEKWWVEEFLKIGRPLYYLHYLPYNLWQRRAFKLAVSLHRELKFDLAHQVTIVGYREPGYLWKLGIPFIWGPVGGTQNYPWRFLALAGFSGALKEGLRNVINLLQFRLRPRVRHAARKAAALIAANSQVQRAFRLVHGIKPKLLLETGVDAVDEFPRISQPHRPLRLLWSGFFGHHKGFPLLVHALAQTPPEVAYELRILGAGPLQRLWQGLARAQGVDSCCRWLGWVERQEAMRQYGWADLVISTSLRETSGNVILEALSRGVPVICLDHQGPGDIVTEECGVKIPVTTPSEVSKSLRESICALNNDRARLQRLSGLALERAREFLWSRNGEQMDESLSHGFAKRHVNVRPEISPEGIRKCGVTIWKSPLVLTTMANIEAHQVRIARAGCCALICMVR